MSTQLRDVGLFVEVSTVTGEGGRKRMPRGAVLVSCTDPKAIKAEAARQAAVARVRFGLKTE